MLRTCPRLTTGASSPTMIPSSTTAGLVFSTLLPGGKAAPVVASAATSSRLGCWGPPSHKTPSNRHRRRTASHAFSMGATSTHRTSLLTRCQTASYIEGHQRPLTYHSTYRLARLGRLPACSQTICQTAPSSIRPRSSGAFQAESAPEMQEPSLRRVSYPQPTQQLVEAGTA